jgi:catechol 2,3-dioxygenase-like lactoylglutathione lyase family enzyme
MDLDLFAGDPVSDYERAVEWYSRLLGSEPSFLPNPTEAVWQVAEHRFLYVDVRPDDAGHAISTLFVPDFDARMAAIAERGIAPTEVETYENGVRKAVFHDPDGNEIGFGGGPPDPDGAEG